MWRKTIVPPPLSHKPRDRRIMSSPTNSYTSCVQRALPLTGGVD